MSNLLHKVVELTKYQDTQVDFNYLRELGYNTVILECGSGFSKVSKDIPLPKFETHYAQAKAANFNIGFYFWFFNNVEPQKQAQEFYNFINGKETNCKFIFDVESGSILGANYNGQSIDSLVQETVESMKSIFKQNGLILEDNDFIIYSSRSFAVNNLTESLQKYGCWIADPNGTPPTYNETISYGGYTFNWIGCQWTQNTPINGVGQECDLDVFKDELYFDKPIIIGQTQGQIGTGQSIQHPKFIDGEYVKLKTSTLYFAPNKIPNTDKGPKYIIDKVNGNQYKLKPINEWVTANELKLIESVENNSNNNSNSTGNSPSWWNNLDFYTKLGIYIGTFEGYISTVSGGEIGYFTNADNWSGGYMSPQQALEYAISYIKSNEQYYKNTMRNFGLDPDQLNENQLFALYDAGYNLTTDSYCKLISKIANDNIQNPQLSDFTSFDTNGGGQVGNLLTRRESEWRIYTTGVITFWDSYYGIPQEYRTLLENGINNNDIFKVED